MEIKTQWTAQSNGKHYRINISIQRGTITIAKHSGDPKSETGGSWDLDDFKTGEYDEYVFEGFDEDVLDEIYDAIKEIKNGSV
ncbi:MAG: hypothetical protein H6582_04570 [Crocinitomicaceae bacterium]|nr:hypothetical protein [Crocinitomicaceae bacterium]